MVKSGEVRGKTALLFHPRLGAAAVRGYALRAGHILPARLAETPLEGLTDQELENLWELRKTWGVFQAYP